MCSTGITFLAGIISALANYRYIIVYIHKDEFKVITRAESISFAFFMTTIVVMIYKVSLVEKKVNEYRMKNLLDTN